MHPLRNAATLYQHLKAKLLEAHPEIAEDDQTLLGTLDGETDIERMIAAVVRSALDDENLADALAFRINQMGERMDRLLKRKKSKRALVAQIMAEIGLQKITADDFTVSQTYTRPAVIITDESQLPDDFWRVKVIREPDKVGLKQHLEKGDAVSGATLSNPYPIITVRTS